VAALFSVASWNVRHLRDDPARLQCVTSFLAGQHADVFAIYEVEGKQVFEAFTHCFPGYTFQVTEGPQTQEILVGVRPGLTAFITQKIAFRSGVSLLRPGSLLTLTIGEEHYTLLFLHTASGTDPRGLGLRDDMLNRALDFRATLDKASGGEGRAHYLFLGDLNTMGMEYPYAREHDLDADDEIDHLCRAAAGHQMRVLRKTHPRTWWGAGGLPPSALDQVVATPNLSFRRFGNAEVDVRGWPQLDAEPDRREWIRTHSDHALLYFEIVDEAA
jgi:hypothetical protein